MKKKGEELFEYMSQLSVEATSNKWTKRFEYELWDAVHDRTSKYGKLNFTDEIKNKLKYLSNEAEGWIINEEGQNKKIVSLKEFKRIRKREIENGLNWMRESGNSLNTSEWFGSLFWYFISGRKNEFNSIYTNENLKRNAITGWIIQILLFVLMMALILYFS